MEIILGNIIKPPRKTLQLTCDCCIVPEQLRSVEEILGEIDAFDDELKALEEGLTL